jgi:hypothetical protein
MTFWQVWTGPHSTWTCKAVTGEVGTGAPDLRMAELSSLREGEANDAFGSNAA